VALGPRLARGPLAVGRLLPALVESDSTAPFVALGVGYALLGLGLVVFGSVRERRVTRALAHGGFAPIPTTVVVGLTAYLAVLATATIFLVVSE
jgi:hypothetical protein